MSTISDTIKDYYPLSVAAVMIVKNFSIQNLYRVNKEIANPLANVLVPFAEKYLINLINYRLFTDTAIVKPRFFGPLFLF